MSTLRDMALKYIDIEKNYGTEKQLYHYNCAEVVLNACNDYYELEAGSKILKAIIPFGGGMYAEKACGAVTGSVAALGLIFGEEKPSRNDKVKNITNEFIVKFEKKFGHIDCVELKKSHRDPHSGCKLLMLETAELLESIISHYR